MVAYALAGAVDGFFEGRDWRDMKEDRKREIERQRILDKYRAEAEARAAERFGWERTDRQIAMDLYNDEQEAARKAWEATQAAMLAEAGAPTTAAPPATVAPSAPGAPPPRPAAPGAGPVPVVGPGPRPPAPAAPDIPPELAPYLEKVEGRRPMPRPAMTDRVPAEVVAAAKNAPRAGVDYDPGARLTYVRPEPRPDRAPAPGVGVRPMPRPDRPVIPGPSDAPGYGANLPPGAVARPGSTPGYGLPPDRAPAVMDGMPQRPNAPTLDPGTIEGLGATPDPVEGRRMPNRMAPTKETTGDRAPDRVRRAPNASAPMMAPPSSYTGEIGPEGPAFDAPYPDRVAGGRGESPVAGNVGPVEDPARFTTFKDERPIPGLPIGALGAKPDAMPVADKGAATPKDATVQERPRPRARPVPEAPPGTPEIREVDPAASSFTQDVQRFMREGDIGAALLSIGDQLALGKDGGPAASPLGRGLAAVGDYFTETPAKGKANATERRRRAEALDWYRSPAAETYFRANPDALAEAAKDPAGFFRALPKEARDAITAPSAASAPGKAPPGRAMEEGGVPLGAVPPETAEAASATPGKTDDLIVETAASAPRTADGKPAPEVVKRATKDAMDYYMDHGAPVYVEHLLKAGRFKEAREFQTWIKEAKTKSGMENWSKAVFHASVGNFDGFADSIVEAYNDLDYYGDDVTIDRKKSDFIRSPETGDVIGAVITFRDEKTGDTFEQVFNDPMDMVRTGISLLAPENAFEWHLRQLEAAQAAQAEAAVKAQEKGEKETEARRKLVLDVMKQLSEENVQFGTLPEEEKQRLVEERIRQIEAMSGGLGALPPAAPPVLYRN